MTDISVVSNSSVALTGWDESYRDLEPEFSEQVKEAGLLLPVYVTEDVYEKYINNSSKMYRMIRCRDLLWTAGHAFHTSMVFGKSNFVFYCMIEGTTSSTKCHCTVFYCRDYYLVADAGYQLSQGKVPS